MKNWKKLGFFVAGFLIFVLFVGILTVFLVQKKLAFEDDTVPEKRAVSEMKITLNGIDLAEINENDKDIKYQNNQLELDELSFSNVELKGRGNATWMRDKKPYQIKLSKKANLLELGERRKWILLANVADRTNLKTDIAFYIERMLGDKFAYSGEFVELYVNDEYEGLYYLTRGIEIGKNAVDLKDPLGVLVELDNVYGKNEEKYYMTDNGECLTVKDIVAEDEEALAMEDFVNDFNALEEAIKLRDYDKISEVIDIKSFARYYLLEELIANTDAYFTSQYFYKDGPEDKIHAGPAWDFDIAMNNENFGADWNLTKAINKEYFSDSDLQYWQWSRLFARLIDIPEFENEVSKVFLEQLSGRKNELLMYILKRATKIYSVTGRESVKWEKGDFAQEIKKLLEWINQRYNYFEKTYGHRKMYYDNIVLEI